MGVGLMLAGAGTALSAASQISGGIAAKRAGDINGQILDNQADYIETQTYAEAEAHNRNFDKFRGSLRADMAAYGASSSTGTGLLMAMEAEKAAKLDELNIVTEGYNQASATRMNAAMARYEGRARKTQAIMGGLGTAMKGFSDMSSTAGW